LNAFTNKFFGDFSIFFSFLEHFFAKFSSSDRSPARAMLKNRNERVSVQFTRKYWKLFSTLHLSFFSSQILSNLTPRCSRKRCVRKLIVIWIRNLIESFIFRRKKDKLREDLAWFFGLGIFQWRGAQGVFLSEMCLWKDFV
jgi:hypothetical protein